MLNLKGKLVSNHPLYDSLKHYIPKNTRKTLKGIYYKYIFLLFPIKTDKTILNEWKQYISNRDDNNADIYIFGITPYSYRHQRPQHLAEQLANKGHRVFYIENEFLPYQRKRNNLAPFSVEKVTENIYKVNLSSKNNIFIYRDAPTTKDKELMISSIRALLGNTASINPVAKIDHPFWGAIVRDLGMPVVYDCMDDHSGFKENSNRTSELEEKLFRESDLVLTSSDVLETKAKKYKPNKIIKLKNAGEYVHFNQTRSQNLATPVDILNIPHPIIGYYGAITDWFDEKSLEKVAQDNKNTSVVLIGRPLSPEVKRLARRYNNIYLLGEKPYQQLPAYLQEFDVCIIPFKITNLIKATNPVKIFEYFASGKPVVATNIPELAEYKKLVYISNTPADFSRNVKKALLERDTISKEGRIKIAKENTWKMRGEVLAGAIYKTIFPKVSVIILSYNNKAIMQGCLESVLKRSFYPNLEIIVVDNNSDLQTVKMLRSYLKDNRVRLIENRQNLGFAAGNNVGMAAATGEYLILLNNDTIVTPGWVSRLLYHVRKEGVGLVGPVTNNIGNEAKIDIEYNAGSVSEMEVAAQRYTTLHWGEAFEVNNIAAFCWIMSRGTYMKVGKMDTRFGRGLFEDDDYCLRVRRSGLKILIADDVFMHHWGGSSTKWNSPEFKQLLEENKKKFESKWNIKWTPHKYRNQ